MPDLRAIFDEDAALYDAARPGYPVALFRDLLELTHLGPGARVLEIGPGTGQATLPLARTGAQVTAVELGASLAGNLRHRAEGLPIEVVVGAFEDYAPPPGGVDVVAAFTAWHWVDRDVRARLVHDALHPGGALTTVTTTHVRGGTVDFFVQVQDCYARWDPASASTGPPAPAEEIVPDLDEVDDDDRFAPAIRRRHHADIRYTTQGYMDLLNTYSGHRALPEDRRAGLLGCVARLIDDHYAGTITKRYLYELRVARRTDWPSDATQPAQVSEWIPFSPATRRR